MQDLNFFIDKYGTDKKISGYSKYYECLFNPIKEKIKSVLEIGIGSLDSNVKGNFRQIIEAYKYNYSQGGSLRVWRDYFINANIVGVDIAEDCKFTEDRIETYIFDSTDYYLCEKFFRDSKFDIIIDDGLHDPHSQLCTLKNFFNKVGKNGFYIIEDLGGTGDGRNLFIDSEQLVLDIIDGHEYFFDRNILIVKKSSSNKGRLTSIEDLSMENETMHKNTVKLDNSAVKSSNLTIVSGLWNIGKQNRSFDHYLMCFEKFLEIDQNMFLFIPKELEEFVWKKRDRYNTEVKIFELQDLKNLFNPFWDRVQKIRTDEKWIGQAGWIKNSPQASLEWYNPIVMSKMSMLHDASIYDRFQTENFIWLDAGISNTVNYNLLIKSDFFEKLGSYLDPFLFIRYLYPYYGQGVAEIHGFKWDELNRYSGKITEWVSRGGLFGGKKQAIREANSYYWHTLNNSLSEGLMGTEESIFSILADKHPELFRSTRININGHIQEFVEKVINGKVEIDPIPETAVKNINRYVNIKPLKVSVYMLTFNFPHQVEHTIQTWLKHDNFIKNTRNILIDNSTNEEARLANSELCKKYNFEHIITNENTGINGGRFRAAKHFQESDSDYYIFLEDDMGIHPPDERGFCRTGFRLYVENLYEKLLKIMVNSGLDFLKLSFTEVYMDNNIQVSWYNVPQNVRTEFWPQYDKLPTTGLDPNCPRTDFKNIEVIDDLAYITGEVYYANWPMIVGKSGNQKMFLDVTWARPYEQTWMSYMYQETKKGNIKPAVLLASPIKHNRIAHYKAEDRREN